MTCKKSGVTLFRLALIAGVCHGFAFAQPVLIPPTPCEKLVGKPATYGTTPVNVYFENRTDEPLRVFMLTRDGAKNPSESPPRVLAPRYAEQRSAEPGERWVVEDETGNCLAGYTAGTQDGRVKIGDHELRVRFGVPPYRLKTTVFSGYGVSPDREEVYIDDRGDVTSVVLEALNLWLVLTPPVAITNPCSASRPPEGSARHLAFDLRHPVTASGARDLGVVRDTSGNLHVFLDHDHEQRTIRNIQELEPGEQAQSERVEFRFCIDRVPHILQVGPWATGEFTRLVQAPLHGEGTTTATVKRVSDTVWETQAPENAIGRLWNNADKMNPIDRGLYHLSFRFRFELLPEEPSDWN